MVIGGSKDEAVIDFSTTVIFAGFWQKNVLSGHFCDLEPGQKTSTKF